VSCLITDKDQYFLIGRLLCHVTGGIPRL